jgi:hypothetical protein
LVHGRNELSTAEVVGDGIGSWRCCGLLGPGDDDAVVVRLLACIAVATAGLWANGDQCYELSIFSLHFLVYNLPFKTNIVIFKHLYRDSVFALLGKTVGVCFNAINSFIFLRRFPTWSGIGM